MRFGDSGGGRKFETACDSCEKRIQRILKGVPPAQRRMEGGFVCAARPAVGPGPASAAIS